MAATSKVKTLEPVRPNAGTEALYRRKLQKLVREMAESVLKTIKRVYKANEPEIAQDEMPYAELKRAVRQLSKKWGKRFDKAAPELAEYFAQAANQRSASQLRRILKEGGFSIEFKMTRAARDVLGASIAEQVSLIKSIPAKYFTDIEGAVMRAVSVGGDLKSLTDHLQNTYGVTHRRAATIARDQNNKALASLTRVRQLDAGITSAVWVHSNGGKTQRKSHVAASKRKQVYDVKRGWFDPDVGQFIQPGQLVGCRCISRPIIPGLG